jgi:hypothetical protein
MRKFRGLLFWTLLTAGVLGIGAPHEVHAAGKIVCWKDDSGKVVGCGDTVPPEYRGNATKELDAHGVTRKTTMSADEAAKQREEQQALAKQKAEEAQRIEEQKRLDRALLNTFTSPEEIDKKRLREAQTIDDQITQSEALLKGVTARHSDLQRRVNALEKEKKKVPASLNTDYQRVTEEKERYEASIDKQRKEKERIQEQYATYKARYLKLRGIAPAGVPEPAKK